MQAKSTGFDVRDSLAVADAKFHVWHNHLVDQPASVNASSHAPSASAQIGGLKEEAGTEMVAGMISVGVHGIIGGAEMERITKIRADAECGTCAHRKRQCKSGGKCIDEF